MPVFQIELHQFHARGVGLYFIQNSVEYDTHIAYKLPFFISDTAQSAARALSAIKVMEGF